MQTNEDLNIYFLEKLHTIDDTINELKNCNKKAF